MRAGTLPVGMTQLPCTVPVGTTRLLCSDYATPGASVADLHQVVELCVCVSLPDGTRTLEVAALPGGDSDG
jgi:hypothetical protein